LLEPKVLENKVYVPTAILEPTPEELLNKDESPIATLLPMDELLFRAALPIAIFIFPVLFCAAAKPNDILWLGPFTWPAHWLLILIRSGLLSVVPIKLLDVVPVLPFKLQPLPLPEDDTLCQLGTVGEPIFTMSWLTVESYTSSPFAGLLIELIPVVVMRGIRSPLLVALTSKIAEGSGVIVPMPTPWQQTEKDMPIEATVRNRYFLISVDFE
jgi:hypothetical protein